MRKKETKENIPISIPDFFEAVVEEVVYRLELQEKPVTEENIVGFIEKLADSPLDLQRLQSLAARRMYAKLAKK